MGHSQISLTPCRSGDSWDGLTDCSLSSDGNAFASPLALVEMEFRDSSDVIGLALSSADGGATINDADSWEFQINSVTSMPLTPGFWAIKIRTTSADGRSKTYITGTIEITK